MKTRILPPLIVLAFAHAVRSASADQITGVGATYWATAQTGMDDDCITVTPDATTCAIFPAKTHSDKVVVFQAPNGAAACAAGGVAIALTTTGSVSGGSYGVGQGAAVLLPTTGARWDEQPSSYDMRNSRTPGMVDGYCPNLVSKAGDVLRAPCRADLGTSDCVAQGGGTCVEVDEDTSGHILQSIGVYYTCDGDVYVAKQKVPR